AALQRRTDCQFKMGFTRRIEKDRFSQRPERFRAPRQDHAADGFSAGRAARFARLQNLDAVQAQALRKPLCLGCLAAALAAFKRNEFALSQGRLPSAGFGRTMTQAARRRYNIQPKARKSSESKPLATVPPGS